MSRRPVRSRRPPPPTPPPAAQGGGRRLAVWWALLLGLWAGRASAIAPAEWQQFIDIAIAIGLALIVALAYRRWIRGFVGSRRGN